MPVNTRSLPVRMTPSCFVNGLVIYACSNFYSKDMLILLLAERMLPLQSIQTSIPLYSIPVIVRGAWLPVVNFRLRLGSLFVAYAFQEKTQGATININKSKANMWIFCIWILPLGSTFRRKELDLSNGLFVSQNLQAWNWRYFAKDSIISGMPFGIAD